MNTLKKIKTKLKELNLAAALKIAGLCLIGIVIVAIAANFLNTVGNVANNAYETRTSGTANKMQFMGLTEEMAYDSDEAYAPIPAPTSPSVSKNAEDYEVTEYSATIKTRNLKETCSSILNLKSGDDVIFETSNEYEHGCRYGFKAEKESAEKILEVINALNPETVSENTYTIVKTVENIITETEILENKLASIEATLKSAEKAYDEITTLATATRDAESLAKIINSKINTLERLTNERISVSERLQYLQKQKAEQLERMEYTYFSVSVTEIKYLDIKDIKNSWRTAVKNMVGEANEIAQGITLSLAVVILRLVQIALYAAIALIIAKYGWILVKYFWKK